MTIEMLIKTAYWSVIFTFALILYKVSGFMSAIWAFVIGFAIVDVLKWAFRRGK